MNNDQFRRLVLQNPSSTGGASPGQQNASRPAAGSATPGGGLLGSRLRSNIPMTPRSVTGVDFARQLADHRRGMQPPSKRFKSSAAPKGAKLPAGYVDRAAQLRDEGAPKQDGDSAEGEDKMDPSVEKRLQALEEMVKLGQIDRETFDGLRRELGVGGDLTSTHLVKGLDWDLLRRVRTGEDVSRTEERESAGKDAEDEVDVDEAFERVLEERGEGVLPTAPKVKEKKKGIMAPAKRSRDEILRELKASRAAAAAAAAAEKEPALGARFKRIGDTKEEKKRWVERDEATGRRKEILQITDAEGKTKRKVRWLDKPGQSVPATTTPDGLLVPEKDAKPLGMEVPADIAAKHAAPPEDDNFDIFEGVGTDYNPLADLGDESDSSDASEDGELSGQKKPTTTAAEARPSSKENETEVTKPARPRNYFSTSTRDDEPEPDRRANPLTSDPTLLAALKRAAALRRASPSADEAADDVGDADAETLQRRRKFIEEVRRRDELDAMDMEMGFGGSRIEDEEDDEGVLYDEHAPKKRKRGPKKRKGDKDSASDVMGVLEGRKKE